MPRIKGAASARWRAPPKTTAAARIDSRPARLNPSMPSSPIPTMDSHRCNAAGWGPARSAGGLRKHILILGGTTEAREFGQHLAARTDIAATLSLAGRTTSPLAQAVPVRRGGFGGITGLAQYLRDNAIDALIDATHPYAPTISAHALCAAAQMKTPMLVLCRPPWRA